MPQSEPASPALGHALRALRTEREMTVEDVAYGAGITFGTVSRIERGVQNPTWSTVERIAEALDVTLVELAREVEAQ